MTELRTSPDISRKLFEVSFQFSSDFKAISEERGVIDGEKNNYSFSGNLQVSIVSSPDENGT